MREAAVMEIARRIVAVPEAELARADRRPAIDLMLLCERAGYTWGALFLQLLQLRAQHAGDCRVEWRTRELLADLRAFLFADAGTPLPAIVVDWTKVRNAVRGDGGCLGCDADQGEAHRPDCERGEELLRHARAT